MKAVLPHYTCKSLLYSLYIHTNLFTRVKVRVHRSDKLVDSVRDIVVGVTKVVFLGLCLMLGVCSLIVAVCPYVSTSVLRTFYRRIQSVPSS